MFLYLKGLGKFRKSKAYGLVGCLALVSMIGLSVPDLPVVGGGTVYADVIQGGDDIKDVDVHSKSAEGVAMTYTTYDSGTSGKQTASGSGVFVAPNVMVTVAHNYYDKNQEDKSAVLRGGESARSYVVMNSETEKNNKVPTSGVSETLEKDSIHLYDEKNFGKDYSNDLAVVVTKKTVEAMTGGEDSPRELSDKEVSTGDKITMVGYPNDFSTPNLSEENKARLKDGKAYSVSTTVSSINKENGAVTYHSSALGGFSGAPLFNDKGEVVGIHQHGTNTPNAQESERIGGGTIFTEKHKAWIRSMIDKYGITGWYIDGANRYYYDENHIALKDVESEIDGALYSFDEKGRATLVKGEEKGRVLLRVEDTKGTRLISDKVVQEGPVGSGLNFHLRQNPDFKQLIATSPTAKVVSYNGVLINKLASDTSWSDEYVSKLALGDTIIRAVVDSVSPLTKPSYDFARTEVGKVDLGGKSNLPVPSKEVLEAPNGSTNFYATTHIQTPDGSGSGTLIAPNLVLTVAHNFLTTKGSEVVTKSGRTNTVYKATLPNGKSVNFSDDDIVYWNKKDSVFGFKNDLALIRLKEEVKGSTPVEVVPESTLVEKGEKVSVYGFPDGRLSPVLDSEVVDTTDFGSGIEGISYEGTKPGASGGGLYNDKGALIGVHQNGVVGSRSGGLVLSKEQLDWVRSYIAGKPKDPVYVKDEVLVDEKDKDKLPSTPKDEKPSTPNLESDKDKVELPLKPQKEPKTEVITTYEDDSTLEVGKERTEDTKGEKEGVPLIYRVVYKGTQPKVEKESIAFDTLYQGDETKELGFRSVVEGKGGVITRTTTYQVDKYTGAVSSSTSEEKVDPKSAVVTLGTKANSSTKELPITERFEDSLELEKGKTEVLFEGSVGIEVTKVTYKVLPDGKVVENSRTVEVTPMKERVIRRGVKEVISTTKVETLVPKDAPTREELPVFSEGFSESEVLVSGEKTQGDLGKPVVSSKELVPERAEESAPTVEKQNFTGGVSVVASPMYDNNRDSKNESTMKQGITRIASSQRIFKNEAGSVQIQASEEVLENVIGVQIQEVQVSDLSSLNYKAFDIQLKDTAARTVQPKGKVLVTFATDQSVESVYAVDPEGNLYTIEFTQKEGKIIFETSNSSIYAMTFRHSIDNPLFKNSTKDKKAEEIAPSSKLLSTNENSGLNQLDKKVGNNEQAQLPDTGENKSITTVLLGFVGIIFGVMISYKRKDSKS